MKKPMYFKLKTYRFPHYTVSTNSKGSLFMSETCTLEKLSAFSGLSERTLRNYLKSGILKGEKADSRWIFAADEISNFLLDPSVRPSIEAKGRAKSITLRNKNSAG